MQYAKEQVDVERSVYNWWIPNFSSLFQVLNKRRVVAPTDRQNGKEKRVERSDLELISEVFMRGQLVQKTAKWQLELRRNGTFICVGLSCLDCVHENVEEIWTRFDIDIVNFAGEVLHSQGGEIHFSNDNLTKYTPLTKIRNRAAGRPNARCSFWETDAISVSDLTNNWNKFVPTNVLKMRLRLYIYRAKPLDEASSLAEYHEPVLLCYTDSNQTVLDNPLLTAVRNLWESGQDADITFEVEGEKIKAHKFVVSVQSPVLKKEIAKQALIEIKEIANQTLIEIQETSLPIFRQLLKYLYTQDAGEVKTSNDTSYITNVLDACNYFEIHSLARICLVRLLNNMTVENFKDIAFAVYSRVKLNEQSFFKTEVKRFLMINQKELRRSEAFQRKCLEDPELFLQLCFQPVPVQVPKPVEQSPQIPSSSQRCVVCDVGE